MSTVNEILTTIQDLALVGSGNAEDTARVLRYINLVYKEAYRRTARQRPTLLLAQESVAITAGAGMMSANPFTVTMVKDTGNNSNVLNVITLPELEEEYPALDGIGSPNLYYFTGEKVINTYPVNDTTLSVRYVPSCNVLTAISTEADIKFPPEFHDMLLWGTLVFMAYDERDKTTGGELNTAQSKYEMALADFQSWLKLGQAKPVTQTKVVIGG
jgi:hypothetical protein